MHSVGVNALCSGSRRRRGLTDQYATSGHVPISSPRHNRSIPLIY